MFVVLLIRRGENIATPPEYIFVFGDEVFNIVILVFVPPYTLYP